MLATALFRQRTIVLAMGALFGLAVIAKAQPVGDRVLSRVKVNETEQCAVVTIGFNIRVQVRSHFPDSDGDHVRIDLKPIEAGNVSGVAGREELRPPSSRRAGIQEIQYDGDLPTGPILTVTFNTKRYFAVDQGGDFQSVILKVSDSPVDEACSSSRPALRTGPGEEGKASSTKASSILHSTPETLDTNAVYALNLMSQQPPIEHASLPKAAAFDRYALYAVRFEEDGVVWNRLRLGFFNNRTEAQKVQSELAGVYRDSWIVRTTAEERDAVYKEWLGARRARLANNQLVQAPPTQQQLTENADAAALVAEAKTQMTAGDYERAIQLLTKALTLDENPSTPEAKELLGVAREKNGQLAHAKGEYEEYLQRYPDNEGAARVRQRLSALLSNGKEAPPALREGAPIGNWVTRLSASISQYYQRDESVVTLEQPDIVPDPDKQVNRNALISGADVTASVSNDRFDTSVRFSGSHTKDFEQTGSDFGTISAAYLDLADNVTHFAARIGRQTRNTGGVLGRFDGGLISFNASDHVRFNLVGGAPVLRSRDLFIDNHRRFAGASIDLNQIIKGVDTTGYFIYQKVDGLVDREAAGLEVRYVDNSKSAYGLIDYDVFYDTLNLALFNGSWRLEDNTTFNASFDYRYAPTLQTLNALQGQGVLTIDDLRNVLGFTDQEVYYLAESRAARSKSGSFTVSHPLSDKVQVNAGVTLTELSPTIDAGGVPGQPGTGLEKYYSAQVLANGLLMEGDLASLGFRFDDMSTARRYVIDVNNRYPLSKNFRLNPRIRLAQRQSITSDQMQYTIKPSMRLNFIPVRRFQIELEGGYEWTQTTTSLDKETVKGYYAIAGYRLDF
ncbi:MAG: tetratricopeptide repeat protein [Parvularculaceae bacterium]